MRSIKTLALLTIGALTLTACGGGDGDGDGSTAGGGGNGGDAASWQYADYLAPGVGHAIPLSEGIFPTLEEEGIASVETFFQESLLSATDILPGVGDGRADLGFTSNLYHPAELPLTYLGSVPFLGDNAEAHARTFNELYETNEDLRKEFEAQGVHVLSFTPLSGTILGSREPMNGIGDMSGKQIRAAGFMTAAVEAAGGNVVAITAPEIYDAMDRGIVDAFTSYPFGTAISSSLDEVSPYIIDTGAGMYILGMVLVNKSTWDGLSEDQRAEMESLFDEYVPNVLDEIKKEDQDACTSYQEGGGEIIVWNDEAKQEFRDEVGTTIVEAWRQSAVDRGLNEAVVDGFFEQYEEAYAKYDSESDFVSGIQLCS